MKLIIEQRNAHDLQFSFYALKWGTREYHYEKLSDVLYRAAMIFEPPDQEMTKPEKAIKVPKRKYTKRSEKFPLGEAILKSLGSIDPGITMSEVIEKTGTPRPYSNSIWGAVMGKLAKKGLVRVNTQKGEKVYRRAK